MARSRARQAAIARWLRYGARGDPLIRNDIDASLAIQTALLVIVVLYTLYLANAILVPIVAAVFLQQLLDRPVRMLHDLGVPLAASAGAVIATLVFLIATAAHFLADPAEQWLREAPGSLGELRTELMASAGLMDEIRELGEEIDELTHMGEGDDGIPMVQIRPPGHLEAITGSLPTVIGGALLAFVTAFFLIVQGERLAFGLVSMGRTRRSRRRISNFLRGVNDKVSLYLRTVTMINVGLGVVVTILMYLLGVPHPGLWGALAGLLNFAPYLGTAINTFFLTIVGITAFDTLADSLLVPATYLLASGVEGMLVTPMILGRRIALGSLVVFLSVVFWGWMWGAIGALMAIPLTTSLLVFWRSWREPDPFRHTQVESVPGTGG